jgi:co-chaperonin GroES (HSP10)
VQVLEPENAPGWIESTIKMPAEVRDREWAAQVWAVVIECGPEAYKDDRKFQGVWCQPGDVIMMRPYSGTRFMLRGHLYALINDDTVQAVVKSDPREIARV